jgi:hypothetical protein
VRKVKGDETQTDAKTIRPKAKEDPIERQKPQGPSKGALAAERASAGIGIDDRDPDNFWRSPTKRS